MRTSRFLVTAALAALVAGCNSKATVEAPAATPVRIATATSGPAAPESMDFGTTRLPTKPMA